MNTSPLGDRAFRWRFGAAEFDEASQTLVVAGEHRPLEPKPARALQLLLRNAGSVVSRSEFMAELWGGRVVVDHVLATAVGKLRKALQNVPEVRLVTIARVGYRLDGSVERSVARVATATPLALQPGLRLPVASGAILEERIAAAPGREVWRATSTLGARAVKFASDDEQLDALKRELTVSRLLAAEFPDDSGFLPVIEAQLAEPPFFLEYPYGGRNLLDWSRDNLSNLNLRDRIELFCMFAGCVSHAHSVGVLHKDIKPQNVLIDEHDGQRVCRIVDFGVSRIIDPDRLSQLGVSALGLTLSQFPGDVRGAGTPLYLAPEIVRGGRVSIQSDVFALGMILFQLIVEDFRRTLAPGWDREIEDQELREDIAWATDQDPMLRPSSVGVLVERLRSREQRREMREERARMAEALARSRAALATSRARRPWLIAAVLALVLGMGASVLLLRSIEFARVQAELHAKSLSAVQRFLAEDILAGLSRGDPRFAPEAGPKAVLDAVAQATSQRFSEDPIARASLHRALSVAYRGLSEHGLAIEHGEHAVRDYREHLGAAHPDTIRTIYDLAIALSWATRFDDARLSINEADTLIATIAYDEALQLRSHTVRAEFHAQMLQPAEALDSWNRAWAIATTATQFDPNSIRSIIIGQSDALLRLNRPSEALEYLERAEELLSGLHESSRGSTERNRARALRALDRMPEAVEAAQAAYEINTRHLGPDHLESIVSLSTLSYTHHLNGDCERSLPTARVAADQAIRVFGYERQTTLIELGNFGARSFECGEHEQGLAAIRDARDRLRQGFGPANVAGQNFSFFLALFHEQVGHYEEALSALDQLGEDAETIIAAGGGTAVSGARIELLRAKVLFGLGQREGAANALDRAREIQRLAADDKELEEEIDALAAALKA